MEITSAIFDPELGCTAFTVERITYTRTRAGTTSRTVTDQAMGCIHPGTPEMLQLLPEEERAEQFITIYTDYALNTGTPEGSAPSVDASSIVAAPHSGDGSFQMTSPPTEFPPQAAQRKLLEQEPMLNMDASGRSVVNASGVQQGDAEVTRNERAVRGTVATIEGADKTVKPEKAEKETKGKTDVKTEEKPRGA